MTTSPRPDRDPERFLADWWRRRYQVLLGLARAALVWEGLWPRAWPALALFTIFLSLALLDVLPMLPFGLHVLVLVAFAAAIGFMARGAAHGLAPVDDKTAQHRLERDSGLPHRPLTALDDRLAAGDDDAGARALWRLHLERMAEAAKRLRVRWPSPGLARRDRFGLRAVVLLFLVIAVAVGGSDAGARLGRALVPQMDIGDGGPLELEVWITPPAYTGLAPLFLEHVPAVVAGSDDKIPPMPTVNVPVGSTLLAQAGGTGDAPELRFGEKTIQFATLGGGKGPEGYRLETVIQDADRDADVLEVRVGRNVLARWPLKVVPDVAPEVEFTRAPSGAGRAHLRLDYDARDDYGLAGLQVVIRHPEGRAVPGGSKAIRAELPIPDLGASKAEGNSLHDFSAHPWAGLPVDVQLQAIDARGQAGESDVIRVVLPERIFNHPVARAIADGRKKLNTPEPPVIAEVVQSLRDIMTRPQHFYDDTIVFLALSVATNRLVHDGSEKAVGTVQEILWETALRIEDGEFSIADRDLREIQERLMKALREGRDADEIERLLDELQQALDKFMAALAEHLEKQGLTDLPIDPTSRMMDSLDLQRLIDEARELARTGARDAARQMLSDLRRMLEGIRNGIQRGGQARKDLAEARRLLEQLRELAERQQKELDKTFRRQQRQQSQGAMQGRPPPGGRPEQMRPGPGGEMPQQGQQGQQSPGGTGAQEQQALRRELGKLMLGMDELFGNIPSPFGKAERAMNDATRSLSEGRFGDAVPQQTDALNNLRQGTEGMAEQLARRLGGAFGVTRGRRGQQPGRGNDPFGRTPGGAYGTTIDDADVKIPDQMERQRARDILDELRRRAGERSRPRPERDYIERLLKRF